MAKATKEVVMQGYLEKKSPKSVLGRSVWQKRYFELVLLTSASRGHEILLNYYKSDSDCAKANAEPLGEIVLNEIMAVLQPAGKPGRFDVQVPSRVFALKCSEASELSRWVTALQQMSHANDYQKPTALEGLTPAQTMKMMAASSASSAKPIDASETIEMMQRGSAFIKYVIDPATQQTTRDIVLVFFKRDQTPLGSLYHCEPGQKLEDATTALSLHALTDLYLGKQSKAFRSAIASHAQSDKCFTAVGANYRGSAISYDLEGDSKEQVAAWLFGLNAILTSVGGRKVMSAEDSAKEEKAKAEAKAKAAVEAENQKKAAAAAAAASAAAAAAAAAAAEEDEQPVSFVDYDSDDSTAQTPLSVSKASSPVAASAPVPAPVAVPESPASPEAPLFIASPSPIAIESSAALAAELERASFAAEPLPPAEPIEVVDVATWLQSLGQAYPGEYGRLFSNNGVDTLQFLAGLTSDDLVAMGVKNSVHLKKMNATIAELKSFEDAVQARLDANKAAEAAEAAANAPAPAPPAPVVEAPAAPVVPEAPVEEAAPAAPAAPAIDLSTLSEVDRWLYKLGPNFLSYSKAFEANGVDVPFLLTLQDDDLEELGVHSNLHRRKMLQVIKAERDARPPAPAAPLGGGYLARAQAQKAAASSSAPAASSNVNKTDEILASIREAKAAKAAAGEPTHGHTASTDGIDLQGTSIAAIAARMAAQREAREKERHAAAAAAAAAQQ